MLSRISLLSLVITSLLVAGAARGVPPPPATASAPQATVAAPASTNLQDFSQGFRAFLKLGLPDTSKARYVKLESYGGFQDHGLLQGLYEVQLSGNAWLISENKDDRSVLVSGTGRTLNLLDQKTVMKKQEAEARSNATARASGGKTGERVVVSHFSRGMNAWAESGSWTPADLSRDLAKATAFVEKKIKAKSAGGREMRYDSFLRSDGPAGSLFLLAAFAWQNGKVDEANLLVNRLFELLGNSRKVIVGALNIVADSQLAATTDAFRTSGDWTAYHAAVSDLVKKYPTGWRQAGAAKLLADRLQARAALKDPPPVAGEGLDDEDRKLAAALVSETNAPTATMSMWGGQLWILPPPRTARPAGMAGTKDETAIGRIVARGVKSIPLLIALASDNTLCPLRRNEVGLSVYQSYSEDSRQSDAERAEALYSMMDRPLTRGEIARSLLTPLCRRDENAEQAMFGRGGAEEFSTDGVKEMYAAIKSLDAAALPKYFLEKGDPNQKQAAVGYMLQNDVESNAPVIEAFLLTPPSDESGQMMMYMGGGMAQQYVQKRGDKAADFVEKYAAMRQKVELPAGMADNEDYVKEMKKQAEREIKSLRAMVKKQDLAQAISELANAGNENEAMMTAYTTLSKQKPEVAVPALLSVAVKTTNAAVRARILQQMPMLRYSGMQESMEESMAAGAEVDGEAVMRNFANKNRLNIGTNAADWKLLLADTRAMPAQGLFGMPGGEWTIADVAASSIEALYGDITAMEQFGRRPGVGNLKPEIMFKITRDRAAARLEGKAEEQLPKYPTADDVPAERRKAIEAEAVKAKPAEMKALLAKLTDAETLYFAELESENADVRKATAPLSRIIGSVKTPADLPAEEAAKLRKLEGAAVSTNAIAEMREVCRRQLAAGKAVTVTLSSAGLGRGLNLAVAAVDQATQRMYGRSYTSMFKMMGGGRKGMITGSVQDGHNYGHGMWIVDLPAATNAAAAAGARTPADDDASDRIESFTSHFATQQEQFETAVEAFCKTDDPLAGGASVSFSGTLPDEPKEKPKAAAGDGNDEEDDEPEFDGMMID